MANDPTRPTVPSGSSTEPKSTCDSVSSENQREGNMGSLSGSCSLKRKRPPMIEIPNVLREIVVDKEFSVRGCTPLKDAVCASDYGVGVFTLKGKKKFMEDAHKMVSCSLNKKGFFGVYDGHGGSKAAEFVAENLHSNIFEMLKNSSGNASMEEELFQQTTVV